MRALFVTCCLLAAASAAGCRRPTALAELIEGRRLASELHVQFTRAADASNRAVMAEHDDAAAAAAGEARQSKQIVERDAAALRPLLQASYSGDLSYLDGFTARYEEYRRLDDEILGLAVENTNLKAQRLSFGPSQEAAATFRSALDAAVRRAAALDPRAELAAARAQIAVLEIQAAYAAHIAEADDRNMTAMETRMAASADSARMALQQLRAQLRADAAPQLATATEAFDRFMATHQQIVALSRRNSDVRSLALSLGRKRTVTAECAAQLQALEEALASHRFTATR